MPREFVFALLMATPIPNAASTPRRRFDPTPLQRIQTACAAPVPRAKEIVLIQPRLHIRRPSASQKFGAKAYAGLPRQKAKQTIPKQKRAQSSTLTIKTMFQRQLSTSGNAPMKNQGSPVTSINPPAPCGSRTSPSCPKQAASVPASSLEHTSGPT